MNAWVKKTVAEIPLERTNNFTTVMSSRNVHFIHVALLASFLILVTVLSVDQCFTQRRRMLPAMVFWTRRKATSFTAPPITIRQVEKLVTMDHGLGRETQHEHFLPRKATPTKYPSTHQSSGTLEDLDSLLGSNARQEATQNRVIPTMMTSRETPRIRKKLANHVTQLLEDWQDTQGLHDDYYSNSRNDADPFTVSRRLGKKEPWTSRSNRRNRGIRISGIGSGARQDY